MATIWSGWYWHLGLASLLAMGGAIAAQSDCAHAQVTPDGTLGAESSVVTPTNINGIPSEQIDGGATRGANLFHSFDEFSVPTGGEAFFNNALDIQNIIGRVTGSSISNIDGLIRANGTANLFLLNPNGIVFGPNASLNIGGSFMGSTASSLNFADGTQFSATAPQTTPLLTVSVPIGLQYGGNAGSVQVQGNGQGTRSTTDLIDTTVGLRVLPNQTLALVGGNVALSGGTLKTAGGRIELGSVAGSGLVRLSPTEKGFSLGYESVPTFGNIQLSQQATVDASGLGGGDIQVQGSRVTLTNSSSIEASTLGAEPGGTLNVIASESVEVIGRSADGQIPSGLFTIVYEGAAGAGGNLTVETGRLIVQDGGQVSASTSGTGAGGTLSVTASDAVEVIGTTTDGQIFSALSAQTEGEGDAGDLTIATGRLLVSDGAGVSTETFDTGAGGTLSVRASDAIEVIGRSANDQISSTLSAQTEGEGVAGDLTIATGRLTVRDGAQVSTGTFDTGAGGTLSVTASDAVELIGTSADGRFASALSAQTEGEGNAGNLTIATGRLLVSDGALVSVRSRGSGNAGDLEVAADSILLDNRAIINGNTRAGQANIFLRSQDLVLRRGSNITTNATGTASGGNINIDTGVLAALGNSDISANAQNARGGRVRIDAQGIFGTESRNQVTPESDITATSDLGPQFSGTVEFNNPDVDPTQGLVELPAELVDASNQIAQGCPDAVWRGESKFIITGRGGLPPNPTEPLRGDNTLTNWSTLDSDVENRSSAAPFTNPTFESAPTTIVEANGWVKSDNGEVTLVATAPTANIDIPWLPESSCNAPEPNS